MQDDTTNQPSNEQDASLFAASLSNMPGTAYTSYRCDSCERMFTPSDDKLRCSHCNHVNRPIPIVIDCPHCGAKGKMSLTYNFESTYAYPYVCHVCLKTEDGVQLPYVPETTADPLLIADEPFEEDEDEPVEETPLVLQEGEKLVYCHVCLSAWVYPDATQGMLACVSMLIDDEAAKERFLHGVEQEKLYWIDTYNRRAPLSPQKQRGRAEQDTLLKSLDDIDF